MCPNMTSEWKSCRAALERSSRAMLRLDPLTGVLVTLMLVITFGGFHGNLLLMSFSFCFLVLIWCVFGFVGIWWNAFVKMVSFLSLYLSRVWVTNQGIFKSNWSIRFLYSKFNLFENKFNYWKYLYYWDRCHSNQGNTIFSSIRLVFDYLSR